MLSFEDCNAIGQITNTSFGYSSTGEKKYQVPAGRSIKCNLSGETGKDQLIVKFVTIVTLDEKEHRLLDSGNPRKRELDRESIKIISDYVAALKKEFKEATGKSLSCKEANTVDSIELINYNIFSPVRQIYYRRNTIFDASA